MLDGIYIDPQPGLYSNLLTLTASGEIVSDVNANPAAVWFSVDSITGCDATGPGAGTRDPQFHDIFYQWNFGDPDNATPVTPLNLPDAWKDINTGIGREACHVYNDAGTFPVTVYAYEPATRRFGSVTFDVEIGNADTVFGSAGDTIIYNPGGVADTSSYPAATVITSSDWADVIAARDARGLNYCRILIAPGVTLTDTQLAAPSNWSNIRIGALDPDNRPTIESVLLEGDSGNNAFIKDWDFDNREMVLHDLNFQGAWDSTTENGRTFLPISSRKGEGYSGNFLHLLHRCRFDGFEALWGCYQTGSAQNTYNVYSDTEITNWRNYGIYSDSGGGKIATVGCSIHQHEDALSGGPRNGIYNNHGPLRSSDNLFCYTSVCDLFARNGWSAGGTDAQGYSVTYDQPCARINTQGVADAFSVTDRIAGETEVSMKEQGSTGIDVPGNHLLSKVLIAAGSRVGGVGFAFNYGGTTAHDIYMVKFNLPEAVDNSTRSMIGTTNKNGGAANDDPVAIVNSTFVDFRSDANAYDRETTFHAFDTTDFSGLVLANNVFLEPNRSAPVGVDGPLDLTTPIAGFTPRHKGPIWGFQHYETTLGEDVATGGVDVLAIPYSEITDERTNLGTVSAPAPTATDQAYWQATAATDTRHRVRVGTTNYHADVGEISVTFTATHVEIRNLSGTDWLTGSTFRLKLDRSSRLAGPDAQYSSVGQVVPMATLTTGSPAIGSRTDPPYGAFDFYGNMRATTGDRGIWAAE